MNDIVRVLTTQGPGLTSSVIKALKDEGLSRDAARKRVQRARATYNRLTGIRFEKNARFIYLPTQYNTPEFWENLEKSFYKSGKSYWCAIATLRARGGICPKNIFPQVSCAPAERKGQLSPNTLLERLTTINMLKEVQYGDQEFIHLSSLYDTYTPIKKVNAIFLAESIALQGIQEWLQRNSFGGYNSFLIRGGNEPPIVSSVAWHLTAPAYCRPLVSVSKKNRKKKPGFLVADINLKNNIDVEEVECFIRKCDIAAGPKNVAPIMPMLIGHEFSRESFKLAKGKGILPITLENFFGRKLAANFHSLIDLLANPNLEEQLNLDHISKVLKNFMAITGAIGNLRGAFFELIIGNLVKEVEEVKDDGLIIGETKQEDATKRSVEIDVQVNLPSTNDTLIIECKSKNSGGRVGEEVVKKWYSDRVPLIHNILMENNTTKRNYHFEIWTNGTFTKSALDWLEKNENKCNGYAVKWRDIADLKKYVAKSNNRSLRKMLRKHYLE